MDVKGITCELCGGSDFYKEAGFFFCQECQTQTQEIQEHVFDDDYYETAKVTQTSVKSKKEKEPENKLTTWDCYNYVLKGLTDEIVQLGADSRIKDVVHKMWIEYLYEIEVISGDKPKLQAVNCKVDAELVYGRRSKRRKRSRSRSPGAVSDSSVSSADTSILRRERAKRKRALAKAQYDHYSSQKSDTSMMNETLESLKSESEVSSDELSVTFNCFAKKELRKRQSEKHLQKHALDFEYELKCHKTSYSESSFNYKTSPQVLSVNKIYSLLYLGLLITKSKIQLGDMLRFIREGHLSFNSYKHFFPDDLNVNCLTRSSVKCVMLCAKSLAKSSLKLARFLSVTDYIKVQNLAELVARFCEELNLPEEIKRRSLDLLEFTAPKLQITNTSTKIPNYEARAIGIILFQLKLLFCIDDKTEFYQSKIAQNINQTSGTKMFDISNWLQFLEYRKETVSRFHFPSQFYFDREVQDANLFLEYSISKNPEYDKLDTDRKYDKKADDCRQLLNALKSTQIDVPEPIYFSSSLTPFQSYLDEILPSKKLTKVEKTILNQDFTKDSLEYILNATQCLKTLNASEKVRIIHGGVNDKINFTKMVNLKHEREVLLKKGRQLRVVKITEEPLEKVDTSSNSSLQLEAQKYFQKYNSDNYTSFCENTLRSKANGSECSFSTTSLKKTPPVESFVQYNSFERYWLSPFFNLNDAPKSDFDSYFKKLPSNFQLLSREFARIIDQDVQYFMSDFILLELYLLYTLNNSATDGCNLNFRKIGSSNRNLKLLINKAKLLW